MNDVIEQFSKRAETYSGSANWISDQGLIREHITAAGQSESRHVLEVCCGTGLVGRSFQDAGWHVCGIDLTSNMALEANRFFPCINVPVEQIPYMSGSFDVVVLRQAYFLLNDGQRALSEIHRVLKPEGRLVLSQTVPYSSDDKPWLEHIHASKQAQLKAFFTEETLSGELEREFFQVRETRRLLVRENITRWLACAPELSPEKRSEVSALIANAPEPYRSMHAVEVVNGEVFEDWNWVIFTADRKLGR